MIGNNQTVKFVNELKKLSKDVKYTLRAIQNEREQMIRELRLKIMFLLELVSNLLTTKYELDKNVIPTCIILLIKYVKNCNIKISEEMSKIQTEVENLSTNHTQSAF